MQQPATLIHVDGVPTDSAHLSAALPADFLEQVRRRLRILVVLLLAAFSTDLIIAAGTFVLAALTERTLPPEIVDSSVFLWANVVAIVASLVLWWAAGRNRVSASRLLTLGLAYQTLICAIISTTAFWSYYRATGFLPNLTWVPVVVILFPMLLPGPPRRILMGAIAAASMAPISLFVLVRAGQVSAGFGEYQNTIFASVFAVVFAYVSAGVVYGLGREVAKARRAGSYELEELLGQGGMGEVWRASHRMLARPAAVKLIKQSPSAGSDVQLPTDSVQRFEREAQATAILRSPHTVELFDFGVADNGAFYFAMELLEGLDADSFVRRFGPVPAERAIYFLRQVCHSLSEAHSHGLVHRDIKPANIFICRYGEERDFVKVLDFGIVKEVNGGTDDPALTSENAISGTPAFLAPEQAMGSPDLDGRCDLYATGCLAYWLLTGQHVFTADKTLELLMHHLKTEPTPPSSRTEMPIPAELDAIVLSCLAKDPAARPQSARELSRQLGQLDVAGAWTEDKAREWWELHQPA